MSYSENLGLAVIFFVSTEAMAGPETLNFDDLVISSAFATADSDRYRSKGLIFDRQIPIENVSIAESEFYSTYTASGGTPTNGIALTPTFQQAGLVLDGFFVMPGTTNPAVTSSVKIRGFDTEAGSELGTIQAFDIKGDLIATSKQSTPSSLTGVLQVAAAGIARIRISTDFDGAIFDNLEFAVPALTPASSGPLSVIKGAATRNMFETFDNGIWQSTNARMPNDGFLVNRGKPTSFFGAVSGGGERVMLLNPKNVPQLTRYGYFSPVPVLPGVEVEARINTLQQGGRAIDAFFELWLVNSTDSSKFISLSLQGIAYGSSRIATWMGLQEINSPQSFPYCSCFAPNTIGFNFLDDTWYRVRITDRPDGTVEASVWTDDGLNKLVSHVFGYPLSDVGKRFYVGFSQAMGTPSTPDYDLLVAIDSITVKKFN